jgi:hypothetical protein
MAALRLGEFFFFFKANESALPSLQPFQTALQAPDDFDLNLHSIHGSSQGQNTFNALLWDNNPQSNLFGDVGQSLTIPMDYQQMLAAPINDWHSNAPLAGFSHPVSAVVDIGQSPTAGNVLDATLPNIIGLDRHPCNWQGCNATFGRKADRERHIATKHRNVRYYHCRVAGCPKTRGSNAGRAWKGYSRIDKLQEHMRKKHAGVEGSSTNA